MGRPLANRAPVYAEVGFKKWPPAPKHLSPDARTRWAELGTTALAVGGVTLGDLLVIERLAQVGAALSRELSQPKVRPSVISQLSRVETTLLREAGLTRRARKDLPKPPPQEDAEHARIRALLE
jgi:phage terminase small subunit